MVLCCLIGGMSGMRLKPDFEIVDVADEYLVVPVGEEAATYKGIVALSEAAAFLLKNSGEDLAEDTLVRLLLENYELDEEKARADVRELMRKLKELRLVEA